MPWGSADRACEQPAVFRVTSGTKGEDAVVSPGQTQYDSTPHSLTFPANVTVNLSLNSSAVCSSGTHPGDANLLMQYRAAVAGDTDACAMQNTACGTVCAAVQFDPANCGTCGNTCGSANGTAACENGICGIAACNAGFADCNRLASDGCETNISNNNANCGTCGNVCGGEPNVSSAVCAGGSCGIQACNPGYLDCNHIASDGCESHINSDANNCGTCGHACLTGHICTNGLCN